MNEHEAKVAFWRTVAREVGVGTQLQRALRQALVRTADTSVEKSVQAVIGKVEGGQTLSSAMEQVGGFSPAEIAMVRVGELGGVLDVCLRRLADGMAEGSIGGGAARTPQAQQAAFWWALGCMLSSGVPILDALEVAAEDVRDSALREAVMSARSSVRDGQSLADALRRHPHVFSANSVQRISEAEERGEVDVEAMRLGDELVMPAAAQEPRARVAAESEPAESDQARKLVNMILLQSVKDHATDIHFEPDEGTGRLRYRIDGALYEMLPPPAGLYRAMVNRVKIMANLDIAETRVPQSGRILMALGEEKVDLRVSTIPVFCGERLVMRILRQDGALLDLNTICGCDQGKVVRLQQLIGRQQGLVVCAGATGSGKTTLLYALLQELNRPERSILTVEDPVEVSIKGISQVQVSPQSGLTMSAAIRQVLRQDPDVMMIGEVRDLETLQACTLSASIGHLVLTTLHTTTAVEAIQRMLELKLEPHLLNSALSGVAAQRLVRRICPQCRKPVEPPLHSLPAEAQAVLRSMTSPTFYSPGQCDACHGTGYAGRMAIHEILICNDEVRAAIRNGAEREKLQSAATKGGMTPLFIDALNKAAQGQTSVEELLHVLALTSR